VTADIFTQSVKGALLGHERLWRVWWLYGAVLSVLANIVDDLVTGGGRWLRVGAYGVVGFLGVLWLVMVWRCADNSQLRIGPIIRASVVVAGVGMVVMLVVFEDAHWGNG
jgi:hypothetical protein